MTLRRVDNQIHESKKRLAAVVAASQHDDHRDLRRRPGRRGDGHRPSPATSRRFPTRDRFAAYNGTAPIEVSSGGRKIFRLSRRGNRTLNHAIHIAAVTQIRHRHSEGRAYYDRKIAEGKTRQRSAPRPQTADQRRALRAHGRRRPQGQHGDGPGRATGERLCRQRGRLTPRNTGSSAKPLPDPTPRLRPPVHPRDHPTGPHAQPPSRKPEELLDKQRGL